MSNESPAIAGHPIRQGEYERLRAALEAARARLPCALVDLDAFDRNLDACVAVARAGGKRLRLASKSIRVPDLMRRALARGGEVCRGLMCYAVSEAVWLAGEGFTDLLVAYPTVQPADLEPLADAAARGRGPIRIVVDSPAHLEALGGAARARGTAIDVVIELDVAYRPLGGALHVGVRRSPVRSAAAAVDLCRAARAQGGAVRVVGLMAYEAHVAGLPDRAPGERALLVRAKQALKRLAMPAAAALRAEAVAALRAEGIPLDIVNGGGTGSLRAAAGEASLTEVTAGSALYHPHLFDGYDAGAGDPAVPALAPSAFFALQVARISDPGFVTCHGGGYPASGGAGPDRLPIPWLPKGLRLLDREGAGEVQTPLDARGCPLALRPGDPVFFRHAKAGELFEHFEDALLVGGGGGGAPARARSYRGLGQRFL